jgi:hypothetical protein
MACEPNVTKGRQLVLLARDDLDTVWEIIGGVKTRGFTVDNPVEDTTSSSTTTDYSESEWTGYSQATFSISGVADQRTGIVEPVTGFNIVGQVRLLELASSGDRCGKFQMLNVETNGFIEGEFNITSYNESGDTPGLLNFDATLQSKADITVTT